jgi:hypothetical protein
MYNFIIKNLLFFIIPTISLKDIFKPFLPLIILLCEKLTNNAGVTTFSSSDRSSIGVDSNYSSLHGDEEEERG